MSYFATKEDYKIKLKGTSLKDPDKMTYSIELTVSVKKFYNFTISTAGTTKSIDPGNNVNFSFSIYNLGNYNDTYSISEENLPNKWIPSYKPTQISIEPNKDEQVSLSIFVPKDEIIRTEELTIKVTSDGNKNVNRTFKVKVVVNQTYDLSISGEPNINEVKPENNAFVEYNITIENIGTGTDSFTLKLTPNVPSGWSYSFAANTGDIEKGKNVTKILKINIPNDYRPRYYYFNVSATSDGDKSVFNKIQLIIKILEIYKFDLIKGDQISCPNCFWGRRIFEYKMKNTGTANDIIYLKRSDLPSGWEAPYPSFVELNMSDEKIIMLNLSIDKDQTPIDYKFWINATSKGDSSITKSISFVVHVDQKYGIQLSFATDTIIERPDEEVVFDFKLSNSGTGIDDFTFTATAPDGWTLTIPLRQNDVKPGESRDLQIKVLIPDNIQPGIGNINLTVRSEGSKEGDTYTVVEILNLYVDVRQKYQVDITPDEKYISIDPNSTRYLNLTIKNKSTGPDIFDIDVIVINNCTDINVTIISPKNGILYLNDGEGSFLTLMITAKPFADRKTCEILLVAKSTKEDYEGEVKDTSTIYVDILPYYYLSYLVDSQIKKAYPGLESVGRIEYKIKVINKGTGNDIFTMKILSSKGYSSWASWPQGTPWDHIQPKKNSSEYTLKVDVPGGMKKGVYRIYVELKSLRDPSVKVMIPLGVDVQRYSNFDVVFMEPSGLKTDPGENATFKIKITNKGNSKENFTLETAEGFDRPSEFEKLVYDPENAVQEIDIGEFKEIILTVTTDSEAEPKVGGYKIPLIVYSKTNLSDMGGDISKVEKKYGNFTVDIQPRYSLTLDGTQSSYKADPGIIVEITLQVRNTGTDDDVVYFDYWGADLPPGWEIEMESYIDPFELGTIYEVTWKIKVKEGEKMGEYFINLIAGMENGTPGDKKDDCVNTYMIKIIVKQLYGIQIPMYYNTSLKPGTTKTIEIPIKNIGTGIDLIEYEIWCEKCDCYILYGVVELEVGEIYIVIFNVSASPKETNPYWNFTLKVESLRSIDDVGYDIIEYTIIQIKILPYYEVTYTTDATTKKAFPTRTSSYDVIFEISAVNRGTGVDTICMEIIPEGYFLWADWIYGTPCDTLQPGEIGPIHQFKVRIPAKTKKSIENREIHILIKIQSTKDQNATDIADFEICVQRYTLFDVTFTAPKVVDNFPGETSTFTIQITNKGNSYENFTAELQPGYTKPNGIKETSYGPSDAIIMLAPEERGQIWVNVTSDPEEAPQSNDVSLMVYSKDNFTDMKGWTGVVRVYDNFTIDLQGRYSFDLSATKEAYEDIDPGSFYESTCQIENTGTTIDTYYFGYIAEDLPKEWSIENPDPITLQPGERQDVLWYLHVFEKEIVGKYYINFTARSKNGTEDPADDITAKKMILFNTRQFFDVEVTKEQLPNIKPGISIEINFTVENTGSGEDQYSVSMKGDITFIDFITPEVFTLSSGKKRNITVMIDPPAEPNEKYWWVNITTKSEKSQSEAGYIVEAISYLNITIKPYYIPHVLGDTVGDADTHGSLIKYYTFNLRLKNDGSGSDTISMAIDKVDPPLKAYWDGSIPWGDTIDTGTIGQTQYNLKIEIPPNTAEGAYNISVWVNSTYDANKNKLINFTLNINIYYEVKTSVLIETVVIYPDQTPPIQAEFIVNITNKGNAKTDFRMKYQSGLEPKWFSNPGTDGILLPDMEVGETIQETIIITVDEGANEGNYVNIKFKIYPEDSPLDDEEIDLEVYVKEIFDIKLNLGSTTPGDISIIPISGYEKGVIEIEIYNDGNGQDSIDLLLSIMPSIYQNCPDAYHWSFEFYSDIDLIYEITEIDVNPYSKTEIYLVVRIPVEKDKREFVDAGMYTIPILAELLYEKDKSWTIEVQLYIEPIHQIEIEYTGGKKDCDPSTNGHVSFNVKVKNLANVVDELVFSITENDQYRPTQGWFSYFGNYNPIFSPGEEKYVNVNLDIPTIEQDQDAYYGDYDITLEVKSEGGNELTKKTQKLTTRIIEYNSFHMTCSKSSVIKILPNEGLKVNFTLNFKNTGNARTLFKIPEMDTKALDLEEWHVSFLKDDDPRLWNSLLLYIEFLESMEIIATISIPGSALEGFYEIPIIAYPTEDSMNLSEIKLQIDLKRAEYNIYFIQHQTYELTKTIEPVDDSLINYTLYIHNNGTVDDIVELELTTPELKNWNISFQAGESDIQKGKINIGVESGENKKIIVFVQPEITADNGNYYIDLLARSLNEPTSTDTLLLTLKINRPDIKIEAEDISIPNNFEKGRISEISVKVFNMGNAKARDVDISFYIGKNMNELIEIKSITLPQFSETIVKAEYMFSYQDDYILVVADKNNEIIESNEANNKASVFLGELGKVELTLTDISIEEENILYGDVITIDANIYNYSPISASNVLIKFYANDLVIGSSTISYLTKEDSYIESFKWKVNITKNIRISAIIDPNLDLDEFSKLNNEYSIDIYAKGEKPKDDNRDTPIYVIGLAVYVFAVTTWLLIHNYSKNNPQSKNRRRNYSTGKQFIIEF